MEWSSALFSGFASVGVLSQWSDRGNVGAGLRSGRFPRSLPPNHECREKRARGRAGLVADALPSLSAGGRFTFAASVRCVFL